MKRTSFEDFPGQVPFEDAALAGLFTYPFLVALEVFDDLVDAACVRMLEGLGAFPSGETGVDPEELARKHAMPARALPPLRFLLEKLAHSGGLRREGSRYFPGPAVIPPLEALTAELRERTPEAAVGAEVVEILVAEAPDFFAGRKTGEEILFSPSRLPLWFRFFSNDNPLYAINNRIGAEALARAAPGDGLRVLACGGGAGSAAELALSRLGASVRSYRFTELVPTFLRRGERAARAAASPETEVTASRLDMTRPWSEQGIEPGSFDLVYSVNCFHVAPDLEAVLFEAERALAEGGAVVVSECMKPTGSTRPVYVELIFDFLESFTNVATDPEKRPTHGFLTPHAWRRSLEAVGLPVVSVLPDLDAMARRYPRFFVAAVTARRAETGAC